jgi:hypothetical protein
MMFLSISSYNENGSVAKIVAVVNPWATMYALVLASNPIRSSKAENAISFASAMV